MIHVKPPKSHEKEIISEKTSFSYSEVEDMLYELVLKIDNMELLQQNNISIKPLMEANSRGIRIIAEQDTQAEQIFYSMENN